jgi:hypothetical protein
MRSVNPPLLGAVVFRENAGIRKVAKHKISIRILLFKCLVGVVSFDVMRRPLIPHIRYLLSHKACATLTGTTRGSAQGRQDSQSISHFTMISSLRCLSGGC